MFFLSDICKGMSILSFLLNIAIESVISIMRAKFMGSSLANSTENGVWHSLQAIIYELISPH